MSDIIAAALCRRAALDQRNRRRGVHTEEDQARSKRIDDTNIRFLSGVIRHWSWPGISLAGEAGEHAAWLIAQHADSRPGFQRECLELLIEAVGRDDAPAWQVAYLLDRLLVRQGRAQRYGTQFRVTASGVEPFPLEDADGLADRRAQLGLPPMPRTADEVVRLDASLG